jgi:hypothetical protein
MSLSKEEINKPKCAFASEEQALSRHAVRQLIPFVSTYLCEPGFSNFAATRIKYIYRINAESDLRI